MITPNIVLNPNVGVAPGTTTMTLGRTWWPYTDGGKLRGFAGLGTIAPPRWGLIAFAGLGVFASVLAYKHWRR